VVAPQKTMNADVPRSGLMKTGVETWRPANVTTSQWKSLLSARLNRCCRDRKTVNSLPMYRSDRCDVVRLSIQTPNKSVSETIKIDLIQNCRWRTNKSQSDRRIDLYDGCCKGKSG